MVTKDVPPFSLVLGNPGKIVGTVDKNGEVVSRFARE
jgi:acetyltransferase-like isoleucine patch superfamily enzyme